VCEKWLVRKPFSAQDIYLGDTEVPTKMNYRLLNQDVILIEDDMGYLSICRRLANEMAKSLVLIDVEPFLPRSSSSTMPLTQRLKPTTEPQYPHYR
jgi:hypothetical protein